MSTAPLFDDLPPWLDRDTWEAYVAMRKEKGKRSPFTDAAKKLTLRKLSDMHARGLNTTHSLEDSIEAGWSGVFDPKPRRGSQTPAAPSPFTAQRQAQGAAWMGRHAPRPPEDDSIEMEP
jgi:hypothetical protein